jgi:Sec-independent protein translocase protein TatA
MELLGVGPLEFIVILVIVLLLFSPKDIVGGARKLGQTLNRLRRSDTFQTVQRTSSELRDLPNRFAREAEEFNQEIKQVADDLHQDIKRTADELNQEIKQAADLRPLEIPGPENTTPQDFPSPSASAQPADPTTAKAPPDL